MHEATVQKPRICISSGEFHWDGINVICAVEKYFTRLKLSLLHRSFHRYVSLKFTQIFWHWNDILILWYSTWKQKGEIKTYFVMFFRLIAWLIAARIGVDFTLCFDPESGNPLACHDTFFVQIPKLFWFETM